MGQGQALKHCDGVALLQALRLQCPSDNFSCIDLAWHTVRLSGCSLPDRSTFWGVAQRGVNTSGARLSAMGRKLKMPPPPLLISTTVRGGRISPVPTRCSS